MSYVVVNYFYNPYEDILKRNKFSNAYGIVIFSLIQLALVAVLLFAIKESATYSRLFLAIQYVCYTLLSIACNLLRIEYLNNKVRNGKNTNGIRVLVVTDVARLDTCLEDVTKNNYDFYDIVGL